MNDRLPRYVGGIHPNCDYHHGQIAPAKGVKAYQITRANRGFPELADTTDSTYKHAPDLGYFCGTFYVQYLCNPKDEHDGAGYSMLASSKDGIHWNDFIKSFPEYKIPACSVIDYKGNNHVFSGESYAYMHQRMSFYRSSENRMLLLGFYGWSPYKWMTNWDNYGIGRVVRELYQDGTLGDIYFIQPNYQGGWTKELLGYPLYQEACDQGFVNTCQELLNNSLYLQQWAEENGDQMDGIKVKHPGDGSTNQAFCWYHLDEDSVIGLWKHSKTARSNDGGNTWSDVIEEPSLVMSGQKIWGQKTCDNKFALVYDPTLETQHRYPLCVVTSQDGLEYDHMLLVHGEVPVMRYEGFWKDFGPQYVRGFAEGILTETDHPEVAMYVTYSVNKEDIWIAKIPLPITGEETQDISDNFDEATSGSKDILEEKSCIASWNIYCPAWASTGVVTASDGRVLRITDEEPYDYCKIERIIPSGDCMNISFDLVIQKCVDKDFFMEICDDKSTTAIRLIFKKNGKLYARTVTDLEVTTYEIGKRYKVELNLSCVDFRYALCINGKEVADQKGEPIRWRFMSAVNTVSRIIFRTGERRYLPNLETDPEKIMDLPREISEKKTDKLIMDLYSFTSRKL